MFGLFIQTDVGFNRLVTEEFDGGRRFNDGRDVGFTFAKLFGVVFGLFWIWLGLAMPFLPEANAPGMSLLLKLAIGVFLVLFGAFIVSAVWRNLTSVLEVDLGKRCLRHFVLDRNDKRHSFREIAFQDIRGVFTEGKEKPIDSSRQRQSLIINYHGRPGRLDALTSDSDQIDGVRDFILTEALQRQAAPSVGGPRGFAQRALWEIRERRKS